MQEALATAAQRQQLESTPEEGGSEAAAAAAAAAAPAAAPAAVGAAAGVAAGGVLGGMLRKLSSKKGAKEAAAAEEAAATAAAAEAAAAAAATQGEAPSNQLTPRPSTDSDAPQQQREGLAMPSPRPRGSMELLPEDMPDVVMVTPAGGGPPVPMVPLSMPENVQASGKWQSDTAFSSLARDKCPAGAAWRTARMLTAAAAAAAASMCRCCAGSGACLSVGHAGGRGRCA